MFSVRAGCVFLGVGKKFEYGHVTRNTKYENERRHYLGWVGFLTGWSAGSTRSCSGCVALLGSAMRRLMTVDVACEAMHRIRRLVGEPIGFDDHAQVHQVDAPAGLRGKRGGNLRAGRGSRSRWQGSGLWHHLLAAGDQDISGPRKKIAHAQKMDGQHNVGVMRHRSADQWHCRLHQRAVRGTA